MTSLLRSASQLRTLLGLAVILGVVSAQAGAGTLAVFTDVATSSGNTFTTGSLDLKLASANDCTAGGTTYHDGTVSDAFTSPLTDPGTAIPGTIATAQICLKNTGTLAGTWKMDTSPTVSNTAVSNALYVRIWKQTDNTAACPTTALSTSTGGFATITGVGTVTDFLTDPTHPAALTTGTITGQSITATPSTPVKLCFAEVLPTSVTDSDAGASTSVQGKSATLAFTFTLS